MFGPAQDLRSTGLTASETELHYALLEDSELKRLYNDDLQQLHDSIEGQRRAPCTE